MFNMKVHATLNNLRITPRKVRLLTHMIIGMDTREALVQLSKQTKRSARPLHDLLKSAVANATNNFGLSDDNLYVLEARVGDGLCLQRWLPRAFGRATPLLHRGSNVTLILEERIEGKNRTKKKEQTITETVTSSTEESAETHLEEKHVKSSAKSDIKQDIVRGGSKKSAGTKVVKKVFQRKVA